MEKRNDSPPDYVQWPLLVEKSIDSKNPTASKNKNSCTLNMPQSSGLVQMIPLVYHVAFYSLTSTLLFDYGHHSRSFFHLPTKPIHWGGGENVFKLTKLLIHTKCHLKKRTGQIKWFLNLFFSTRLIKGK